MSGGMLEWEKFEEITGKLTRATTEVDEEGILRRGQEFAEKIAKTKLKRVDL